MKTVKWYGALIVALFTVAILWSYRDQLPIIGAVFIGVAGAFVVVGWLRFAAPLLAGMFHGAMGIAKHTMEEREQSHRQRMETEDQDLKRLVVQYAVTRNLEIEMSHGGTIHARQPRVQVVEANETPLLLPAPNEALPVAPSFSQIVSQIRPGHLFLGQGTSGAIWGDIVDLLSTLIAGRPGTGKSTQLRNVCGQILRVQGQPVIFDPHGSIVDDLGNVFQCAETADDITDQSKWITGQLDTRLIQRRAGQSDFKPLLLLVDEMPIVASMSVLALEAIRRIVLEGRKVGMFALISGQGVPASILGGTLVRDAMSSRYVFCTSPQQARMAGIENETAKKLMALLEEAGPGKAVMATASRKPEIVAVPYTSTDDIRMLVSSTGNTETPRFQSTETRYQASFHERDTQPFTVSGSLVADEREEPITEPGNIVGNDLKETIRRMRKEGMAHRKIANLVGLAGRKYSTYQHICAELGIVEGDD